MDTSQERRPNLGNKFVFPSHSADALLGPRPHRSGRVFSDDQFFPGVVRGVGQELEDADKQLVLMMARSPAGRDRIEAPSTGAPVEP